MCIGYTTMRAYSTAVEWNPEAKNVRLKMWKGVERY
jgi:hypothetical protein